ncbi:hypothetical protein [Falsiroseomonas sp.]|uniref:hypothetical protein n=1 Tax=Falsiroseomonas sp. TaxID=2870721 RepID=UPI00271CB3F8|nr:hypothetical protein [Falsiroseomonas sp.]MDO9503518.1 hypothetical protein [Falsiroseomonas sp.]
MTERKTPRFSRRLVRAANKPSTALIQKTEVGVKWTWKRGAGPASASQHRLVGGVAVEDQVQIEVGRGLLVDQIGGR